MLGKPKFKHGDLVQFDVKFPEETRTIKGYIYIIDEYGTFQDNTDVSYDIMDEEEKCLYKHVSEKFVTKV